MRFPIKSSIIIFLATFVSLALSAPSEDDARAVHYEEKPSILELPYGSFEASSKQGVV